MKIVEKERSDGREWSFNAGKQRWSFYRHLQIALLLKLPLDVAALVPGISKKALFSSIDALQARFGLEAINDFIIQDEELLGYRIERVVREAIMRYEATA